MRHGSSTDWGTWIRWCSSSVAASSRALDGPDDPAVDHDRDPVAEQHQLGEVGGDDEDAGPRSRGIAHQAVDLLARADIDADGRLVEQQDPRPRVAPLGEHDLLLVAARQVLDRRSRCPGAFTAQPAHAVSCPPRAPTRAAEPSPAGESAAAAAASDCARWNDRARGPARGGPRARARCRARSPRPASGP